MDHDRSLDRVVRRVTGTEAVTPDELDQSGTSLRKRLRHKRIELRLLNAEMQDRWLSVLTRPLFGLGQQSSGVEPVAEVTRICLQARIDTIGPDGLSMTRIGAVIEVNKSRIEFERADRGSGFRR